MPDRLSPQREAEICERAEAATPGPWGVYEFGGGSLIEIAADLEETGHGYKARRGIARLDEEPLDNDPAHDEWTAEEDWAQVEADAKFVAHARDDVSALLAELAAVRAERDEARATLREACDQVAERDHEIGGLTAELEQVRVELAKYVGSEPTIAEGIAFLSRCVEAVHEVCDAAEEPSLRWENPPPVPEWVAVVREAADGVRAEDSNDRRRRIYIDGTGEAWLSLSHENGVCYIGRLAGALDGDETTDSVRERTGSIREIGRCW
ncbi:hypothetical protein [Streptomyces alboflavus]|nr:hypothetical protein [Streptomyces alboflavus]